MVDGPKTGRIVIEWTLIGEPDQPEWDEEVVDFEMTLEPGLEDSRIEQILRIVADRV